MTETAGLKRRYTEIEPTTFTSRICKGCGQRGHDYLNCWYLFPERTPPRFVPRKEVQAFTKCVLENDTVLAEEIQRIRLQYKKNRNLNTVKKESSQPDDKNADVD